MEGDGTKALPAMQSIKIRCGGDQAWATPISTNVAFFRLCARNSLICMRDISFLVCRIDIACVHRSAANDMSEHTQKTIRAACLIAVSLALGSCGGDVRTQHATMARAVLERAGGDGVFADASNVERAAIRHVPSGMVCPLPSDGAFDLEAFPPSAANQGAYCSSASGGVATTFVAVHFGANVTLDQAFSEAVSTSVGSASPVAWEGQPSAADRASPEGMPHFRIARFQATIDGAPHYLRVSMTEADGWFLQQIVSAPLGEAVGAESAAGQAWRAAMGEFASAERFS